MSEWARRFEDLEVFRRAYRLSLEVHRTSLEFPRIEQFALADQVRRASKSICANIAEGFDGGSDAEIRRFLRMSKRSATELQSHLYVALDQRYVGPKEFKELYDLAAEAQRLVGGFIRYLRGEAG